MKKNEPDYSNSTYWWIMNLAPGNKKPFLTGYSKFQGQSEANDKINCLIRKIYMLYHYGWLDKCTHIDIYKRLGPLPNKQVDRNILILYPNDYEVPDRDLVLKMPVELKTFLDKFYECLNTGKAVEYLLPKRKEEFSKDDLYQVHKYNFTRIKDLHDWCVKKIADGEPRDMVMGFYEKYLQHKQFLYR